MCITFICMFLLTVWHVSGATRPLFTFYLFMTKSYKSTQKNTKKIQKKQMNKELDYDTHNDSIIRSMSAAAKIGQKINRRLSIVHCTKLHTDRRRQNNAIHSGRQSFTSTLRYHFSLYAIDLHHSVTVALL